MIDVRACSDFWSASVAAACSCVCVTFFSASFMKLIIASGCTLTASTIFLTPTLTAASIWCVMMGRLANGTRGFGTENVRGRRRVP